MSDQVRPVMPAEIRMAVYLTWAVAALAILSGVAVLVSGGSTLAEAGVTAEIVEKVGWIEIGLGVVLIGVATGLGEANRVARLMVTALMAVRILWAVWTIATVFGSTLFWLAALGTVLALVVTVLLWSSSSNTFFATR